MAYNSCVTRADKVYFWGMKELSDVSQSQDKENLSKNGKDWWLDNVLTFKKEKDSSIYG